jgi:hypothetical protein
MRKVLSSAGLVLRFDQNPVEDGEPMLDAYIIDRIRREREKESRDGAYVPLQIDAPRPQPGEMPRNEQEDDREGERGSVIIDFQV